MSYTFPKSGRVIHDVVPYSFVAVSKTGKETTRYMLKGKDEEGKTRPALVSEATARSYGSPKKMKVVHNCKDPVRHCGDHCRP